MSTRQFIDFQLTFSRALDHTRSTLSHKLEFFRSETAVFLRAKRTMYLQYVRNTLMIHIKLPAYDTYDTYKSNNNL